MVGSFLALIEEKDVRFSVKSPPFFDNIVRLCAGFEFRLSMGNLRAFFRGLRDQ